MKSSVSNIVDFKQIPVPTSDLQIEIPSWQAVAQPLIDFAKVDYQKQTGQVIEKLEDHHIAVLDIPANSLADLKKMGSQVFQDRALQKRYYDCILPFILNFYANNTNTVLNDQELTAYTEDYLGQVKAYATKAKLSIEEYGQKVMGMKGSVMDQFKERAKEDFIFKLIAQDLFVNSEKVLSHDDYDAFINQQVLASGADEIDLRQNLSFEEFCQMYPEMHLGQAMADYYMEKIKFVINPQANLGQLL